MCGYGRAHAQQKEQDAGRRVAQSHGRQMGGLVEERRLPAPRVQLARRQPIPRRNDPPDSGRRRGEPGSQPRQRRAQRALELGRHEHEDAEVDRVERQGLEEVTDE